MSDVFGLYPRPPQPGQNNPMDVMERSVGVAARLTQMQQARLQMQTQKIANLHASLGGLAALGDKLTVEDYRQELLKRVQDGTIDAATAAREMAGVTQQNVQATVYKHQVQLMDAASMANSVYGTPFERQVGGYNRRFLGGGQGPDPRPAVPIEAPPAGRPDLPPAGVSQAPRQELTPGALAEMITYKDIFNNEFKAPRSLAGQVDLYGHPTTGTKPLISGVSESQQKKWNTSMDELTADRRFVGQSNTLLYPMQKLKEIIEAHGTDFTGMGSEERTAVTNLLQTMGLRKPLSNDANTAWQEANKYAVAAMINSGMTQGADTDLRMEFNNAANPNTKMQPDAMTHLLASGIGLFNMRKQVYQDFTSSQGKSGIPDQLYGDFKANNVDRYNPDAFIYPHLDPYGQGELRSKYTGRGQPAEDRFLSQIERVMSVGGGQGGPLPGPQSAPDQGGSANAQP